MKPMTKYLNCLAALRFWAIGFFSTAALFAQPFSGSAVRSYTPKQAASFEESRVATERAYSLARQTSTAVQWTPSASGTPVTPVEIVELTRALKNDPDLIFQYVHDNIEYTPLWGLLKGPVGTLLDGRGDAFDQCSLLAALLNQASLANPSISNIVFEIGFVAASPTQLQGWLGVDADPASAMQVLNSGAIPHLPFPLDGNPSSVSMGHVWLMANIDGVSYTLDPAYKSHTWKSGIISSLPGIMGYTQAGFIADANAAVTATSVQGVNRNQLRTDLTKYAGNLASYIRQNAPTASVSDIIGGEAIVPTPLISGRTIPQGYPPFDGFGSQEFSAIPAQYMATLSVTLPGASAYTFNSSDIYGHRLSIFFDSNYVPTLYLDGAAIVSGTASTRGEQVPVVISTALPWATFANQSVTQYIRAQTNQNGGSAGYVLQTGWDQVGRGMIEKHRTLLSQAIKSGATLNSELVLGESLAMEGYTWLAERAAQQRLSDQLLQTTTQYYYGGGIVGEAVGTNTSSPYVDMPLNFINTATRVNGSTVGTATSLAAFLDGSGTGSAFESASLEQTQAQIPGFVAASTVKLLDIAMQNGDTIFDINNGNTSATQQIYTNIIRPQLAPNYSGGTLSQIDSYVNQGYRVIAPLHGQTSVGAWTGAGFKTLLQNDSGYSYGDIISGGLNGGFGGSSDSFSNFVQNMLNAMRAAIDALLGNPSLFDSPGNNISGNGTGNVGDPIDHLKGSYHYHHDDLTTGAKDFPYGLTFERSYDSNAQLSAGPLGAGWTHNFAINANIGSDGFTGMGQSTPLAAVGSIVALYVSSDLMKNQAIDGQANLENFALETVVNRWFTDQLTQNVVNVSHGWTTEQFVKMPDGTYAPPLGSATLLDAPGGNFRYRMKTGITQIFNSTGLIASWANAAGALVTFGYSGSNLSNVTNSATGRQLSFSYSGNTISSVSDGTRSVSYTYSNGNLTAFNDALGQNTTYAYDTSGAYDAAGHLSQVFYPSNPSSPFVSNFYDSLGRVKQQKDANGNLTQSFFAGARTEIDDPAGNRSVWYNDARGNVTTAIQDYGYTPHLNITTITAYDGQNDVLLVTMPEGNATAFTYDSLFNPLTITKTPKLTSTLSPVKQTFTYSTPVAAFPNFEETATATDANGNTTTFSYSSSNGTLTKIVRPTVNKPGAGIRTPQEQFTYTAIGLPQTVQDAEGQIIRYDYDPTHADQIVKATRDYGRLNLITQYGYDAYADRTSVTDANGHTTISSFDKLRRLVEVDGAIAGTVTKFTYTPDGQRATLARQVSSGIWETTQYAYTLSGKLRLITDPLGSTTAIAYDADDRKQTVTQQVTATQNRQRTYGYDALSRLFQVSDTSVGSPGALLETHTFTPNGREAAFIDADGHTTTYSYDGLDRPSQTTYPDATSEVYAFDFNGNATQKTTRSGGTIGFTYDSLSRVSTKTPSGEAAGTVTFGYDLEGRVLQASDLSSSTPYQIGYDTAGRVVSFTDQLGRNVQAQYDGVGNRTRLQWPTGTNGTGSYFVTYAFDALNRMVEIDANGSSAAPLAKYQWDSLSRQTLVTYGDGTLDSYSQYDASDNLQVLSEIFNGGVGEVSFSYAWQKNQQRQSTMVNNASFQYAPSIGTTNYTSDGDNGYTTAGSAVLTYDGNHNLTFDGFNTLTYDVENRLVQAQNGAWGTSQYFYDPLGHRKQKLVGGATTQFVLAGGHEIADYSGSGSGPSSPLSLTVRGVGGLPVATIVPPSGAITYYHHDILGSTVAVSQADTAGPADTYTYGEFGLPGAGSWANYRFASYRYDNETGLYYVRTRYYSPALGRFLQPDSIGYAGGAHLYAYSSNDPVNRIDPFGTCDDPAGCRENTPEAEDNSPDIISKIADFVDQTLQAVGSVSKSDLLSDIGDDLESTVGKVGAAVSAYNIVNAYISHGTAGEAGQIAGTIAGAAVTDAALLGAEAVLANSLQASLVAATAATVAPIATAVVAAAAIAAVAYASYEVSQYVAGTVTSWFR